METERTLEALLRIWHELPRLIGPDYGSVFPRLHALLGQLDACRDAAERDWLVDDLLVVLEPFHRANQRLRAVRALPSQVRGTSPEQDPDPQWERDLLPAVRHRLAPPEVVRYTDITAPQRLTLEKRGAVVVGLTRERRAASVAALPLTLRLQAAVEVHLVSLAPAGLEVLNEKGKGKKVKSLVIEANEDAEPVVFYVVGHTLGSMPLRLDFHQDGVVLASLPLAIEVVAEAASDEQHSVPAAMLRTGGDPAPPPDLELRILYHERDGHYRFTFVLHAPTGGVDVYYREIVGEERPGSAASYYQELWEPLDLLAKGRDARPHPQPLPADQAHRRLIGIGQHLFDDLCPATLKAFLRDLQASPVHTLTIASDEPWIPWELLRPDIGDLEAETFLCERYALTRWLAGSQVPVRRIGVGRLSCIEAADGGAGQKLAGAVKDRLYLGELAHGAWLADESLAAATREGVLALLDGKDLDLWHFSAHGKVEMERADQAVISLVGQEYLRPVDMDRRRQHRIGRRRPLVFLNVCQAGRQGRSLTGLSGWVRTWVERCRCGALVAPLLTVDDELAHLFCRTFYQALQRGVLLGEAVHEARQAAQKEKPGDPTWIAYSVYGHPNARVAFGTPTTPELPAVG